MFLLNQNSQFLNRIKKSITGFVSLFVIQRVFNKQDEKWSDLTQDGTLEDKGMGGRYVGFLYTICRYIATIHTDIVEKLTRSVEIVSQKKGHYFLNQHYLYKDRLYLLVRQDLLK